MNTLESDLHDGCSGRVLLGIPTRDETYEIAAQQGFRAVVYVSLGQKSNAFRESESIDRSQP
jgi:hypothetical protein